MAADETMHSYQPANGHGLPHDPFNAIVGPRPIGWISSRGTDGTVNLAPYSFFNAFNYTPPIIGFSSVGEKDSLRNIRETREFVWNLATRDIAEQMNLTSTDAPYGTDEFAVAGLTPVPAKHVAAPRVKESRVHFECKVSDILNLRSAAGAATPAWLVIAEVIAIHIDRSLLKDGIFDTYGAGIILRTGGPTGYAEIKPDSRFDMRRPKWPV
ncbi:MAG TPA: flavin reductase family protein [Rhodopila sp.]|nr:flavin reductase family protein [Rhodopila sp.]